MKTKSRFTTLIIISLLIAPFSLFAQEKDHFILGRLQGSELIKTELKNYEQFIVPLGKIENEKFSNAETIEGKIERRLYKPIKGTTVLEVYKNYLIALDQMGAEILFKGRGGEEIGSGLGPTYYKANPMMGQVYNNGLPWDFLVVEKTSSALVVAKLSQNNKAYYVNLIIGNGYEPYTIYQLDIIEVVPMEAVNLIVNNNTDDTGKAQQVTPATSNSSENSTKSSTGYSKFSFQAGMGSYNFYDPQLYGEEFTIQSNGVYVGTLSGFRDLSGLFVKTAYFFNENIGITADIALHHGENGNYIESGTSSITYTTNADMNFQRIGLAGRFIGNEYPIKLSFNTGIGVGTLDAYYQIKTNTTQIDYEGKTSFPMVFFQTEIIIPIISELFIFTQYEYSVGWADEFRLVHDNGTEYNEILYKYPGMGGNSFRVGLGYEFGGK